jgi:hypothetical protein
MDIAVAEVDSLADIGCDNPFSEAGWSIAVDTVFEGKRKRSPTTV